MKKLKMNGKIATNIQSMRDEYMEYLDKNGNLNSNFENFKDFLIENGFQLDEKIATELFNIINNETHKIEDNSNKKLFPEMKMRNRYPRLHSAIKKVVIPTVITAMATTGVLLAMANYMFIPDVLPLFTNSAKTILANSLLGVSVGTGATIGYFSAKNAILNKYYHKKFGTANENVLQYEQTNDLQQTKINSALVKIENTNNKIRELKATQSKNIFSRLINPIKSHYLVRLNNCRMKYVEDYAKQLANEYYKADNRSKSSTTLQNEYLNKKNLCADLLRQISDFAKQDIKNSQFNSLFTNKKSYIYENIDTYSRLRMYLDITEGKVSMLTEKRYKEALKSYNNRLKAGQDILNGHSVLGKHLSSIIPESNNTSETGHDTFVDFTYPLDYTGMELVDESGVAPADDTSSIDEVDNSSSVEETEIATPDDTSSADEPKIVPADTSSKDVDSKVEEDIVKEDPDELPIDWTTESGNIGKDDKEQDYNDTDSAKFPENEPNGDKTLIDRLILDPKTTTNSRDEASIIKAILNLSKTPKVVETGKQSSLGATPQISDNNPQVGKKPSTKLIIQTEKGQTVRVLGYRNNISNNKGL